MRGLATVYQYNIGSNPDSVLAWSTFDFTKSATVVTGTDWETVMLEDWHDVPNPGSSVNSATSQAPSISNYPEPFNPSTTIHFSLPAEGSVSLAVFNLSGARVATLVDGYQSAGDHQVTFDGSRLASGLYTYRLSYAGQSISNKMMLVK